MDSYIMSKTSNWRGQSQSELTHEVAFSPQTWEYVQNMFQKMLIIQVCKNFRYIMLIRVGMDILAYFRQFSYLILG